MLKEFEAAAYLCACLNFEEIAEHYQRDAEELRAAIQEHCWDERDGFFYNVDLNLLPSSPRESSASIRECRGIDPA